MDGNSHSKSFCSLTMAPEVLWMLTNCGDDVSALSDARQLAVVETRALGRAFIKPSEGSRSRLRRSGGSIGIECGRGRFLGHLYSRNQECIQRRFAVVRRRSAGCALSPRAHYG